MMQLVALLDLPARDQLTRVRLVVRRNGRLSTSGTGQNCELSEHEIHELEQHGVLLKWADAQPSGLEKTRNPAGFWMGAEVRRRIAALTRDAQFPVPRDAVTIAAPPWDGVFWIQEPETIKRQREAWVTILAQHAMRAAASDERKGLWELMLATLPAHELTRAVGLHTFKEDAAGRAWFERQLAAEGRSLAPQELANYHQALKKAAVAARDSPKGISARLQLQGSSASPRKRSPGFDQREAA